MSETCKALSTSNNKDIMVITHDNKIKAYAGEGLWKTVADGLTVFEYNDDTQTWEDQVKEVTLLHMTHDSDGTCYVVTDEGNGLYNTYRMVPPPAMDVPVATGVESNVEAVTA